MFDAGENPKEQRVKGNKPTPAHSDAVCFHDVNVDFQSRIKDLLILSEVFIDIAH